MKHQGRKGLLEEWYSTTAPECPLPEAVGADSYWSWAEAAFVPGCVCVVGTGISSVKAKGKWFYLDCGGGSCSPFEDSEALTPPLTLG